MFWLHRRKNQLKYFSSKLFLWVCGSFVFHLSTASHLNDKLTTNCLSLSLSPSISENIYLCLSVYRYFIPINIFLFVDRFRCLSVPIKVLTLIKGLILLLPYLIVLIVSIQLNILVYYNLPVYGSFSSFSIFLSVIFLSLSLSNTHLLFLCTYIIYLFWYHSMSINGISV